jgi:hypothetical protein
MTISIREALDFQRAAVATANHGKSVSQNEKVATFYTAATMFEKAAEGFKDSGDTRFISNRLAAEKGAKMCRRVAQRWADAI